MPRTPPVPLSDLPAGPPADCYALLAEKVPGLTKAGKPFFTCTFRDRKKAVVAKVWADSPTFADCDSAWTPGTVYKLRATLTDHPQYGPQLDVLQARPATPTDAGYQPGDYAQTSRRDPAELFAELRTLAEAEVGDPALTALTLGLLDAQRETLLVLPATVKHFYPYPGGWLEHTLSVAKSCRLLCEHYADRTPPLNRPVVLAAAVLHDVGRAAELAPAGLGLPPELTVDGHLTGHVLLGRDMVRAAARAVPDLAPDTLRLLDHVILSHLNIPAWGAARLPLAAEAVLLHHADDLDAKLEMYARCVANDAGTGPFTDRDPVLGKQLWKGSAGETRKE